MKFTFKISIFTFLILSSCFSIGQHADCDKMLILKDTIYQAKAIAGFGAKKEFEGNNLEDIKTFEEEKNSIWYFITAPADGVFTFDIISENEADDWDFLLFEYKKKFCKRIEDGKIAPIRTNLSRSPITGLSNSAIQNFVGAGINENYSQPLKVKKGEKYVLVVNNPKRSGGKHTLKLHFPKKQEEVITTKPIVAEKTKISFKLEVKDKENTKPLLCNLNITGLRKKVIELQDISKYETEITKRKHSVVINASAAGYMLTSTEYKISKTSTEVKLDVLLEPIAAGKRVNLKKIQFFGNRYDFLPTAKPSLKSLLSFMQINPTVVIEVEGHVNGPGKKNSKSYKELSYSRAYAVKGFLIKNGIEENRIDFKGYGNSKMLYPDPKSEFQQSANRRVEIKILSK
jgi:outer membrane protein OmpA-like peptidoglycan-associated protein